MKLIFHTEPHPLYDENTGDVLPVTLRITWIEDGQEVVETFELNSAETQAFTHSYALARYEDFDAIELPCGRGTVPSSDVLLIEEMAYSPHSY